MAVFLLLALLGVLEVLGQATHNTVTFSYQACSNVDVSRFGAPLVFPDGRVTPEACQASCQGHRYAALMPNACRCGDDPNAVHPIDESKCDFACMGDRNLGMCGSVCPDNSPKIANIYTRAITPPAASNSANGGISQYQNPPVSSASTCSSSPGAASALPTDAPRITTAVPPPAVKTPDASLPPIPSPLSPPSSSCTSAATPNLGTPAPPVGSSLDLPTHAPEPSAYPHPTQPAPGAQPSQVPPGPSPQPYTGSQTAAGDPGQLPSGGVKSAPPGASSLSPVVTESTLWPKTSASKSSGILPVPSQVPGSDSSHGSAPPLLGIGGLAVAAAMLM